MLCQEIEDGETTEYEVARLSLITSQTNWELSDDQLTLNSNGKIRVATVTELTQDTLTLVFEEFTQSDSADGTISITSFEAITYDFIRD